METNSLYRSTLDETWLSGAGAEKLPQKFVKSPRNIQKSKNLKIFSLNNPQKSE